MSRAIYNGVTCCLIFHYIGTMDGKRIEELGYLAFDKGFFTECQSTATRYIKENRFKDPNQAYESAYVKFSETL